MADPAVKNALPGQASGELGSSIPLQGRLLVAALRSLGALPVGVRSCIGYGVGFLIGLLPLRDQRVARLQLGRFFGSSSRILAARSFGNAGQTLMESLNLAPLLARSSSCIEAPQWPEVEKWLLDKRPLIALTGHTGNWDLLAAYTIARGVPLTTVGREARSQAGQELLRSIREGYGIETIWRSDRTGVKRLVACMKERRTVAALIDQDTDVESIYAPFFGEAAKTPSALIALGQRCNARFVSAFMFRTGPLHFETFIEEFESSLTAEALLAEYNARLERLVRRFPGQWVWFHKRWRSRPDGERLSTSRYTEWLRRQLAQPRREG